MSQEIKPLSSIERALIALFERDYEPLAGHPERVGGEYGYKSSMPWFIRIDKVPGGSSDRFEGTFVVDIEVFGRDYLATESVAFELEALVLGYPHSVMVDGRKAVIDYVFQNSGVADLPWEDDKVFRLGATYAITARRR